MRIFTTLLLSAILVTPLLAQDKKETKEKDYDKVLDLNEVTVEQRKNVIHTERLPDVHQTYI